MDYTNISTVVLFSPLSEPLAQRRKKLSKLWKREYQSLYFQFAHVHRWAFNTASKAKFKLITAGPGRKGRWPHGLGYGVDEMIQGR